MYMRILWLLVVCICRHNSVSDSAAEGTQTTGYSAVSVVQDPHGASHRFGNYTTLDFANLAGASLQGPLVPEPCASGASFCQDGELKAKLVRREGDESGMEMLPLQANEQEACRFLPVLWYTLGAGNRQLALDWCRRGDSSSEKPECPPDWADQIQRRWERKGQGEGKRHGQRQGQWQERWPGPGLRSAANAFPLCSPIVDTISTMAITRDTFALCIGPGTTNRYVDLAAGIGGCAQESVCGLADAAGGQGSRRKTRVLRDSPNYKGSPLGYDHVGSSPTCIEGCATTTTVAPQCMAGSSHGVNATLGRPTGGVQKAPNGIEGSGTESIPRHCLSQIDDPATQSDVRHWPGKRDGGPLPGGEYGDEGRHRGGGTPSQTATDIGPVCVRCRGGFHGGNTFRCRRGRASTSKEGKVCRKGQKLPDGRPNRSNWLVTMGCFFTCPLVKGGSIWPINSNDNAVEAYCEDFVSYSSAAGNIVITPDPWSVHGAEDFTNPFKAILNAQRLRSEVLMDATSITAQPWYECRPVPGPRRHRKAAKISFSQEVELVPSFTGYIRGDLRTQITHDQFQDWHQKPWSLRVDSANHHGYPHVYDRWCDSCDRKAPNNMNGGRTENRLLDEARARTSRQRELGEEQNRPPTTDRRMPRRDPGGESSLYPLHDWQDAFLRNEHLEDRTTRVTLYGIAFDALRTQQGSVPELTRTQIILLARRLYPELYGWNMKLHLVTPQPSSTTQSLHVLPEFLPQHHDTGNEVPTLLDLKWFDTNSLFREVREARYYPTPASWTTFMDGLQERCFPAGSSHCSVWVRGLPCFEGVDASTHRGDLVSIRILPTWSEELQRGVAIQNGQTLYEYCTALTSREILQGLRINILTPIDSHFFALAGGFNINTIFELGMIANQIWGSDHCLWFCAPPSNTRDGLYFTITQAGSDATPVVLEQRVLYEYTGPRRHIRLMLVMPGSDMARSIVEHTEPPWHDTGGTRTISVNGRLLNEEEVSNYHPHGADHVLITIPDPGHRTLSSEESVEEDTHTDASSFSQVSARRTAATPRENGYDLHNDATCSLGTHVSDRWCDSLSKVNASRELDQRPRSDENRITLELDHLLRRPLAHAFASAETLHQQDIVVTQHHEGTLTVVSFGHKGAYIEKRTLQVAEQERHNWRRRLREQWSDYDDGSCFEIHGVIPPPISDSTTITVIVQLATTPNGKALVLIQFVPSVDRPEDPFLLNLCQCEP